MVDKRDGRVGLVIVNTGSGKGKTTASLGLMLRAWGQGMKTVMLQFIKTKTSNYGENKAARKLGVEMVPLGAGFTWLSRDIEKDKALAREGWDAAKQRLCSEEYDLVILDELTYTMKYGWLSVEEVLEALRRRPSWQHVVITGRDAPPELIEYADLVTEMKEIKHPYKSGVKAQPGVEF
ncbi:MAG: cob(I)yrinic acid a,c-diamide adenosyltransferase [Dehalococcoidia bacterium]|nr:cob(I)yrinic acid a,c-diamide adenosyltransferase [Dehalococcoidia bacterium]